MCHARLYGKELNGELSVVKRNATKVANRSCRNTDKLFIYDHRPPYGKVIHVFVRNNEIYGSYYKPGKWEEVYSRN